MHILRFGLRRISVGRWIGEQTVDDGGKTEVNCISYNISVFGKGFAIHEINRRFRADKFHCQRAPDGVAVAEEGGIGIFGIPEMNRFYRHVLIAKNYPHHGAVAFGGVGKALFSAMKLLGVEQVSFNQPKGMMYPTENPFA